MRILAIDTSTKFLCLGIYDNAKLYEYNLEIGRKLSSLISVTIKRVMEAAGLHINDIDYFACGLGPGSFTGMRVGLATIKGLSWSLRKPVVGVSTLDVLAAGVQDTNASIVPIIDAKRDLIYCAVYKKKIRRLLRLSPYMLLNEEEFFRKVQSNSVLLGDAIVLYKDKLLKNIKGARILDKDYWYPKAHNIIELVLDRIKQKKFSVLFSLRPIYLYPKECQIKERVRI
jgi:tRNA threonylcarbamoyl adenosine modification protein YeaZ